MTVVVSDAVLVFAANTVRSVAGAQARFVARPSWATSRCAVARRPEAALSRLGFCQAPEGCVTSDRVMAVGEAGRLVASQRLHHARFRMHLAPGRYTIELVGDGKHVHGRVMQRKTVIATSHRITVIRFFFAVP